MIPKVIHYCWFGRNPLPESAVKCIDSWRRYMPDYEIKEWNEDNFDVNGIPYTADAYKAGKFAFVSDYARYKILYEHGGVYFDTDVELIKPIDDILERGAFMGIESIAITLVGFVGYPMIAPGLGMAVEPGHEFYRLMIERYQGIEFYKNGSINLDDVIVLMTTKQFMQAGLKKANELQYVADIWLYPIDYFNPFEDVTGRLNITENTRSIHWYARSWLKQSPVRIWLSRMSHRIFGLFFYKIKKKIQQS